MRIYCVDLNRKINKPECRYVRGFPSCVLCPNKPVKQSVVIKHKIKYKPSQEVINICKEQFKEDDGHLYFLGLLAYPKANECKNIANFVTSVLAERFKALADAGHCRMSIINDRFRTYEKRKAQRNIMHTLKRINDKRLKAAWLALCYINKWEPSLNKTIEDVITKSTDLTDKSNIYNNIWIESKPVLHLAMAVFPMLHNIYGKDIKSELDIKKDLIKQIKKTRTLNISDLCIIPSQTARKLNIKEPFDLLKSGWLKDILQVANVYYDLLPAMIPSINKKDLIKLL